MMKLKTTILFALALLFIGSPKLINAQYIDLSNQYQINKDLSYLNFNVSMAGYPVIQGLIESYQATMYYDPENIQNTSATLRIASESFTSARAKRDEALLGVDFLNAEKHPAIWFISSGVKENETGFDLMGELYIKEIVKPATVKVEKPTIMKQAMNNLDLLIAKGDLTINRKDFELGTTGHYSSNPLFGDDIKIEFIFTGFSYTPAYLKANFLKQDNPVGMVYQEVVDYGTKKGLKLAEELSKDKRYIDNNWLDNLANIGWILMVDGYGEESIPFYNKALELDPGHLGSLLRLGDAYTIAGKYDEALEHFKQERTLPERARFTHIPHMINVLEGDFELKAMN